MYGQISNLYFTSQEAIYTQFATINNTVHRVVKSSRLLLKIAAYMYLDSIFFYRRFQASFYICSAWTKNYIITCIKVYRKPQL